MGFTRLLVKEQPPLPSLAVTRQRGARKRETTEEHTIEKHLAHDPTSLQKHPIHNLLARDLILKHCVKIYTTASHPVMSAASIACVQQLSNFTYQKPFSLTCFQSSTSHPEPRTLHTSSNQFHSLLRNLHLILFSVCPFFRPVVRHLVVLYQNVIGKISCSADQRYLSSTSSTPPLCLDPIHRVSKNSLFAR